MLGDVLNVLSVVKVGMYGVMLVNRCSISIRALQT